MSKKKTQNKKNETKDVERSKLFSWRERAAEDKEQRNDQRFVILWFYGSYGLFYLLAIIFRMFMPTVHIPFVIAETGQSANLSIALAELFDLLYLGILFSFNAHIAFDRNYKNNVKSKVRSKYYMLLAIIILNFGVIVHMTANNFHDQLKVVGTAGLEDLEVSLYFWDEIASHFFTGLGLFMLILINLHTELHNPKSTRLKSMLLMWISFAVGIGIAFGLTEGQWGIPFGVLCLLMVLYIPLRCKIMKVSLNDKSFMKATFFMCLGYLLFIGGWIIASVYYGTLKDIFPYVLQPSEVFNIW